jgi:hypothetical protein
VPRTPPLERWWTTRERDNPSLKALLAKDYAGPGQREPFYLERLLRVEIGQLKAHTPDAAEVKRLLAAAGRNIVDARVTAISPETRFDAAYKALMQVAGPMAIGRTQTGQAIM